MLIICMDDKYFRCDTKNIGLTMLCKFDGDVPLPAIWSHQARRLFVFLLFLLFCISISSCICLLFLFVFPNQVLEEYKKRYPEEELPDFLRLNLVCWINLINFDRHQFRDHVKDNAIRTYLRAPKKAALFESKRFCKLVPLNNRTISSLVKWMKHQIENIKLGLYEKEGDNKYNAFDKDIAVVHFFFQVITVAICL